MQSMNSNIDKAKHFFVESGILGPTNFKNSSDLIRKTSTIHIDTTLKNQIRKTSLCLRHKGLNETNTLSSYDESLINLQNEIYNMRDTLLHGETKIVILRTEIGKLKQGLQAIMPAQVEAQNYSDEVIMKIKRPVPSLCLFCQPINTSVKGSSNWSSTFVKKHKNNYPNKKALGEKCNSQLWISGK
ncbi:uncharacterized protein LOC108145317 isoform X1 [Drosophila elegans]|uniref:uncharacterized protein LOC108145317 isoform X1 n=1 Tax=Drosophila elegans TaxID=30023 RepID=UPI0007E82660|nr:uncharacterized protein LOC108145317 isoform X1 [Drosophila elegans]XP_017126171.1 uncharacterized protein LOC108145317 isoform X1 [Drosophila elegans]XP_017126172.1 uncharacterized protein LOC108145317 isoform X1 [Drosophila elegans]